MASVNRQIQSLLLWERGLKSFMSDDGTKTYQVAPLVGAWIEIETEDYNVDHWEVAPLVGAWIEILFG